MGILRHTILDIPQLSELLASADAETCVTSTTMILIRTLASLTKRHR